MNISQRIPRRVVIIGVVGGLFIVTAFSARQIRLRRLALSKSSSVNSDTTSIDSINQALSQSNSTATNTTPITDNNQLQTANQDLDAINLDSGNSVLDQNDTDAKEL